MEITVIIHNILFETMTTLHIEIDKDMSIQDLFYKLGNPNVDISEYYYFSKIFSFNEQYVPYIFSQGRVLYDVNYSDVRVLDFMKTHGIVGRPLHIKTGYPQAGGPGFLDLEEIWNNALPILNEIALICSISGISLKDFIKWFCFFGQTKKRKPQTIFDIVYSRTQWNHHELASLLEFTLENTKALLKLSGYEYNSTQQQYIQGNNVNEIKKKLINVKSLDI